MEGIAAAELRGFKVISEQVGDLRVMAANPKQRTPTGIADLDELILGPALGEVYTFVGRSFTGKSLMATNIMVNNLDRRIIFFSLEMPAHQVVERLYSHLSKRSGEEVTYAVLNNKVPGDLDETMRPLSEHIVVDAGGLTLGDMAVYIANYTEYFGTRPDCIIIDYLEEVGGAKASGEGWTRTEATASALKSFARQERIAVYSLHQANQKTEQWEPPVAGSAKGGGYTESDVVIGIWRPGWDPGMGDVERRMADNDINLNVIKNRVTGRRIDKIECVITPSMEIRPIREVQLGKAKEFDQIRLPDPY